ncbi:MAG: hypothetical protein WA751_10490, partial [Candidatus Dormiibacterota bacterium]
MLIPPFLFDNQSTSTEYAEMVAALKRDPDFGPALDTMIGNDSQLSRFSADSVVAETSNGVIEPDGRSILRKTTTSARLAKLRTYITASQRHTTMIAPFPGLKSYRFPIEIEPGLEIDALTPDEVGACYIANLL